VAKLAVLDRDGVINVYREHGVRHPGELVLLPGSATAIGRLNRAGIKVAIATNQSIVSRGIITEEELSTIHACLFDALKREGAYIDLLCFCCEPGSDRYKPGAGMVLEALRRFDAVPVHTPVIGDDLDDLEAGASAGCQRILVRTGKGAALQARGIPQKVLPVSVFADLAAAVDALLDAAGKNPDRQPHLAPSSG
jgi:D-glycero-D-manno-heptose 1,7-bisphosphate phosphatase